MLRLHRTNQHRSRWAAAQAGAGTVLPKQDKDRAHQEGMQPQPVAPAHGLEGRLQSRDPAGATALRSGGLEGTD